MRKRLRILRLRVGGVFARALSRAGVIGCPAKGQGVCRRCWGACEHAAYRFGIPFAQMLALLRRGRLLRFARPSIGAVVVFLVCAEWTIQLAAIGRIQETPAAVLPADVALVLGTARTLGSGVANRYYAPRLDAAVELFRLGKIRGIIVSGDNSRAEYSEPDDMKADLVARGVPAHIVTCDYAGFSTHDSMQRVTRVFGQSRVIVVSQRFHLERALFLARAGGLEVAGCAAGDVPLKWRIRVRLREVLARGKAVVDVGFGRGPKFLGPLESVPLAVYAAQAECSGGVR